MDLGTEKGLSLMQQSWPVLSEEMVDDATAAEMDWVIRLITGIRSVRSEMNVPGGAKIPAMIDGMMIGREDGSPFMRTR